MVLGVMPCVQLWLLRWYEWKGTGWSCKHQGPILNSSLAVGSKMMYLRCDKDQWRWRSKCMSYVVLRDTVQEQ